MPASSQAQQQVELYLAAQGPLLSYWAGASRPDAASPYAALSGSPLPQQPGLEPYAHWTWNFSQLAASAGHDCVLASSSHAYDL